MMDYLQKTDLQQVITTTHLHNLTGGNDTLLDEAEALAAEEMSHYLSTRYDIKKIFVPNTRPQSMVARCLMDLMLYHLYSRITPQNVPEVRKDRYNASKDWLEKVADAFINPQMPQKEAQQEQTLPIFGGLRKKRNDYY